MPFRTICGEINRDASDLDIFTPSSNSIWTFRPLFCWWMRYKRSIRKHHIWTGSIFFCFKIDDSFKWKIVISMRDFSKIYATLKMIRWNDMILARTMEKTWWILGWRNPQILTYDELAEVRWDWVENMLWVQESVPAAKATEESGER